MPVNFCHLGLHRQTKGPSNEPQCESRLRAWTVASLDPHPERVCDTVTIRHPLSSSRANKELSHCLVQITLKIPGIFFSPTYLSYFDFSSWGQVYVPHWSRVQGPVGGGDWFWHCIQSLHTAVYTTPCLPSLTPCYHRPPLPLRPPGFLLCWGFCICYHFF